MNKIIRFSVPFMVAFLFISILMWLAGVSSETIADSSPSPLTGSILVNTLADELNSDGDCSLREAITAANTNTEVDACGTGDVLIDTITFDVAGMITVTSQLSVTAGGPLVIDGGDVVTTSGVGTTRVWWVDAGSFLMLSNLAVIDGYTEGSGAGLYNDNACVTIDRCKFIGNQISGDTVYGGGIWGDGGVLAVYDSLFEGNKVVTGTIYGYGGGIAMNGGSGVIIGSVFNANQSRGQCDMYFWPGGGGVWSSDSSLTIKDSSFLNNIDPCGGGGVANIGSGTLSNSGSIFTNNISNIGGGINSLSLNGFTIINSTLTGNHQLDPDPINKWGCGIAQWNGNVTMVNCTVDGNNSGLGGGIYTDNGTFTAINSIISNNTATIGGDCWQPIIDGGHNISSDDTCGLDPANGSMPNTDPLLGPLQDNGGPTFTHALLPGSPAIVSGDNTQCPETDQRGVFRPQDGNGDGLAVCDMGSFEVQGPPVPPEQITITGPAEAPPGPVVYFTAVVEPISTSLPITYTWHADLHPPITETMGLTDTVGWAWETPGTYTITVTAKNLAGSVSTTHVITITNYELFLPAIQICQTSNPVVNGDFEMGDFGWTLYSPASIVSGEHGIVPISGTKMASVISYGVIGIDPGYFEQSITIPADYPYLIFSWSSYLLCGPVSGGRCGGDLSLSIDGTPLTSFHAAGESGMFPWRRIVVDTSEYQGKTIMLRFTAGSFRDAIYNYIDDISFSTCR